MIRSAASPASSPSSGRWLRSVSAALSDIIGNRKLLLVIATIAFSACSFLTGLASSFAMLIGARILMGVAEGGVMPVSHAMVASEVSPERRGLAQGIAQNFGSNFFGSFVAPVVLTWLAAQYGWRNAFYIAGIPGIVSAMLIWFFIKEPVKTVAEKVVKHRRGFFAAFGEWVRAVIEVLKIRNIWVCVVMGILLVAYLVICWAFMPLYLTQVRGYTDSEQAWLMGTLGISATIGSFATAGLSDKIGRRPVMIAMPLISMLLPLGVLFYPRLLCGHGRDLLRRLGAEWHLPTVHGDGAVGERQPRPGGDGVRPVHGQLRDIGRRRGAEDRRHPRRFSWTERAAVDDVRPLAGRRAVRPVPDGNRPVETEIVIEVGGRGEAR